MLIVLVDGSLNTFILLVDELSVAPRGSFTYQRAAFVRCMGECMDIRYCDDKARVW